MSSAVRAFKAATSRRSSDDEAAAQEAEKYRLIVTAGPSYDKSTHKVVGVNTGEAVSFENEFVRAKVQVRIRGYRGLPGRCPPTSPYFDDPWHAKDQYSVAFSFVPKQDLPSLDTIWGNDFDHPVRDRLPPGFNTAFKIVKEFIDPGLQCDAYADEPWLYGPSLSCWFAFRLGEKVEEGQDFPAPGEENVTREGADGSGQEERERLGLPENNEKRRKYFLDAKHREGFVFQKGRYYEADFFNPYLDFGNCALKLPGFSLNVIKYVDQKSHCLRYVFKNRETGDVYLNVNIALLWDEDLRKAVEADKEGDAALQAVLGNKVESVEEKSSPHDSLQAKEGDEGAQKSNNPGETAHEPPASNQEEDYISRTTGALKIDSVPASNDEEATRNPKPHDDGAHGVDNRPSVSGLTVVEHVSDGGAPLGTSTPKSDNTTGAQTDSMQDLLNATATSDKRGSETGIF
ncbi:hypothetical protein Q7P35_012120 [Cladosporium inversicolor]